MAKLSKAALIELVLHKETQIIELTQQLDKLNQARDEQKNKEINKTVNEPSSKKPEWDKDGNPKSGKKKRKKKKCKRQRRPGCGNSSKSHLNPQETHHTALTTCPDCATDLSDKPGTPKPSRLVEDSQPPAEKTVVTEEIEETKWCPQCKKMVSSKTTAALPGSDIGLNAMIEMAYLWVMCALSMPNIKTFFNVFKTLKISTTGISKIMIRLSNILQPVYEEILSDVKQGAEMWADETGWRVNGLCGGYGSLPINEMPTTGQMNPEVAKSLKGYWGQYSMAFSWWMVGMPIINWCAPDKPAWRIFFEKYAPLSMRIPNTGHSCSFI